MADPRSEAERTCGTRSSASPREKKRDAVRPRADKSRAEKPRRTRRQQASTAFCRPQIGRGDRSNVLAENRIRSEATRDEARVTLTEKERYFEFSLFSNNCFFYSFSPFLFLFDFSSRIVSFILFLSLYLISAFFAQFSLFPS